MAMQMQGVAQIVAIGRRWVSLSLEFGESMSVVMVEKEVILQVVGAVQRGVVWVTTEGGFWE